MKEIWILLLTGWLAGCATKAHYTIAAPHALTSRGQLAGKVIGVERIRLPGYMQDGKIAIQHADNRITYLEDADWAVDLPDDLTDTLIFDLQKSLQGAHVLHYPWEASQRLDAVVSISVTRFIAYRDAVYLDAIIRIGGKERVVSLRVPVDIRKTRSVVAGMQKAFERLEDAVIGFLDDISVSKKAEERDG